MCQGMLHFTAGEYDIITYHVGYVIMRYFAYHIHIGYDITSVSYMPSIIGQIIIRLVYIILSHYPFP